MSEIEVRLKGSVIGEPAAVRKIVWSLGLRRLQAVRRYKDNNCTRGALNRIQHLVDIKITDGSTSGSKKR